MGEGNEGLGRLGYVNGSGLRSIRIHSKIRPEPKVQNLDQTLAKDLELALNQA